MNFDKEFRIDFDPLIVLNQNEKRELPEYRHEDLGFVIVYEKIPDNDMGGSSYLIFKLKVNVPSSYHNVKVTHEFALSRHGDPSESNRISSGNSYVYDDGRQEGAGPHGMNRSYKRISEIQESYVAFDDEDDEDGEENGRFYLHLRVLAIEKKADVTNIIWKLKEALLPPDQSEIEGLRTEVEYLEKEVTDFQRQAKANLEKLPEVRKEIDEKSQVHDDLTKKTSELNDQNRQARTELNGLQTRIMDLQKRLKVGNIDEFLRKFDESQVDFAAFNVNELKFLLTNILKLQVKISNQIMEEELCAVCMENRRNLALEPCGHLYFCTACSGVIKGQSNPVCPICAKAYTGSLKVQF